MPFLNPYKKRLNDFPGRIFTFDSFETSRKAVREVVAGRPIICEIGSGSGEHIIAQAARQPAAQCFGFELRYKRAVRTIEKALQAGVNNVFVLRTNASQIEEIFEKRSLRCIYVNFPDPWEKARHEKHRLLCARSLQSWYQVLAPGGFLSVKTDHQEYFQRFLNVVKELKLFQIVEETTNLWASLFLADNIQSEFEKLFSQKGISICYARLVTNLQASEMEAVQRGVLGEPIISTQSFTELHRVLGSKSSLTLWNSVKLCVEK